MTKNLSQTDEEVRLQKLANLKKAGVQLYPEKFKTTHSLAEAKKLAQGKKAATAGRLVMFRDMGKLTFGHLQDFSGRMQIAFKEETLGKDNYKLLLKNIDLGDFLGVSGKIFTTHKGEVSILVDSWTFLGKALLPLPEKWHGLQDQEAKYRQRYLDLISNRESMERFIFRSNFIKTLREFYWQEGFTEVETSTLLYNATGAAARPYHTHNNALDVDLVLRISHELPLKELIAGGFEKIFELGKAFRNEGHDPSHLPEHTHLEHYAAYWNFEDNITFTEKMFDYLFKKLKLPKKIKIIDKEGKEQLVNFSTPWPRVDFVKMLKKDSGLDVLTYKDVKTLLVDLKKKKIEIENMTTMSLATLIDNIYKKISRPKIINPTILYHYPKILQPLARTNDKDEKIVDQFQLVVNGWEIVKAYSELVDPLDQQERFREQKKAKKSGDEEAMDVDEEFITALKYGLPPISGWGMGIDRIVALLTQQTNLRDVVLFPLMKPKEEEK